MVFHGFSSGWSLIKGGLSSGWFLIQSGLSSEMVFSWFLIRVVSHRGWSLIRVVSHPEWSLIWGGFSWFLIRVVSHRGWSLIRVVSNQGGLSSTVVSHLGWFFMVSHQGGLSPGWCSLILDSPASKVPQHKVSIVKTSQEVHKVTRVKLSLNQGTYQNPSLFGTAGSPGTLTEPNLPSRLTGSSSGCPLPAS